jgi:AAA ATPase-like protein
VTNVLYGRDVECDALDRLLDGARCGQGGALVLSGEAGMGKSALLDYAANRATGMRVLRAAGVQAEMGMPFAGLHAALRPSLGLLAALPAPQAAALAGALGLRNAPGASRFLVAAGVLSLLTELAEEGPVLCLVDDAQWRDAPRRGVCFWRDRRVPPQA